MQSFIIHLTIKAMEYDLLFTITDPESWKKDTTMGKYQPDSLRNEGYIQCINEGDIQDFLNSFEESNKVRLLIVIDPLRVKSSIKNIQKDGIRIIQLLGSLELDAVIDKIKMGPDNNGKYTFSVKNFD